MKYLLIIVVGVAVLLVLYLLARIFKPLGQALAFVATVVSRVNVKLAEYMTQAADYCHTAFLASLRYPSATTDRDYWHGIDVLSRLVFFILAVCILAGETVNTLIVLPALFQTADHVALPGIVALGSAALFICCPALFGSVIWECWEKIPHGAGLFPRMGKLSQWVLGVIAAFLLLFTILVNGYFYLFRAAYLADPQSAQGMVVYILGGLGIEVAAVSPFALWALVVGGCGVCSLSMWLIEHFCRVIAAGASFLPQVLDVLAVHLSQGTMSVHGEYVGYDPYKVPGLPFSPSRPLLPGQSAVPFLVEYPSKEDTDNVTIFPVLTSDMEEKMHNPENAAVILVGSFGSQMYSSLAQKIKELRATGSVRSLYYLDLSVTQKATAIDGILDLSDPYPVRQAVLLHEKTQSQAYRKLLNNFADRLVETHLDAKAYPAPLLFFIDCHQLVESVEMLESISHRLPLHSLVVVTELASQDLEEVVVQTGMGDMQSLHAEDFLATVMVSSPHSPFATHYGVQTQHGFLAHTLVGLVLSHTHSLHNRSFVNVLRDLHNYSPFTAVSFASERVAAGKLPKRFAWLPLRSGTSGSGNYGDVLTQLRTAIDRCVTEEETRAFPSQVNAAACCMVLASVPIALHDSRFNACERDTALYCSTHYPFATSSTVRGNGTAYPHHIGSRFLVQAACMYPLQPASLLRLQEAKQVNVTPLAPVTQTLEPSSNGQLPSRPQQQEPKPIKGASTTRQKKPAPAATKRLGRKSKSEK